MSVHTATPPVDQVSRSGLSSVGGWSPATRVAFRFCIIYFSLFILLGTMLPGLFLLPGYQIPLLGPRWAMGAINAWTAQHVFGVDAPFERGNSGDTLFYWVQTCWTLSVAVIGTVLWSIADRARRDYVSAYKWFRLVVRFALASQMFFFGMAKVIPTQFVPPALTTIVQPVGNLTLSGLLWVFIGASTPYQMFTGWAEVAAGVLLLTPKTTPLGALICMADMIQVFALNAFYDFGLKQISFHYIAMSVFLLAPDLRRLGNVLLFDKPAPASSQPPLFATPRANRMALAAQIAFGLYLAAVFTWLQARQWDAPDGPAHPRSALYGIWEITSLAVDGQVRPTELNDYDRRWTHAIFDFPDRMMFQRTDDSLARYGTAIDTERRLVVLTKGRTGAYTFAYERPANDRLTMRGVMDEHTIQMELQLVGRDTFPLLNSSFRWVRPAEN